MIRRQRVRALSGLPIVLAVRIVRLLAIDAVIARQCQPRERFR
jgi:hypothetical protein